jgi:hypothetical protein
MIEDENMQQNVAASAIQSRWRAAKNKTDNRKRGAGGRRAGVAAEAVNFKLDYGVPVDEQVRDRRKWTVFSSKRSRFVFGKAISFYQDRLGTNSKREELCEKGRSFSLDEQPFELSEGGHVVRRKRHFLSHLYIKAIILPRQARDKHRESTPKKEWRFSSAGERLQGGRGRELSINQVRTEEHPDQTTYSGQY